ncbi:hypothetical protein SO802_035181, partial [Lithocarpus litseifolius]
VEEGGCYFLLRIVERGKYFMRSVFIGKNASQWLMNHIEHIVVGASSKQFFTYRDGDTAFTLQRSTNSSEQFFLLTKFKVGGSRRSVIIPEGKRKNVGGTGHPKFIPQVLRHNLEAQNARTFAEAVQGFHGRVEDGKQLKQLSVIVKGKMTQLGEEKMGVNQRFSGAKVGVSPMGKPDKIEEGRRDRREQRINEKAEVGEQNLANIGIRFPSLSLNAKALEKGKKSVVRSPCWSGRGLIVEVDVKRRRRVSWDRKKRGVQKLKWVTRAVECDCNKGGPKDCIWVARGSKKAEDKPIMGLGTSPRLTDTHVGPLNSVFSSPSLFEVGKSSSAGTGSLAYTPGNLDKVISRSMAELFLSEFFLSLSRAGLVDLGVNAEDEGDWAKYECLNHEIDYNGLRPTAVLEHDQSKLVVLSTKAVGDVPRASVLVEEDLGISDMGLGGKDILSVPLMTITPTGMALSAELNYGTEAVGCGNTLDVSSWVKYRLPGFSKLVGLSLSRHEKLCIALL